MRNPKYIALMALTSSILSVVLLTDFAIYGATNDLAVTSISSDFTGYAEPGDRILIYVDVKQLGDVTGTGDLTCYADRHVDIDDYPGSWKDDITLGSTTETLDPQEETSIIFTFYPTDPGNYWISAEIVPTNPGTDDDLTNNFRYTTLGGVYPPYNKPPENIFERLKLIIYPLSALSIVIIAMLGIFKTLMSEKSLRLRRFHRKT